MTKLFALFASVLLTIPMVAQTFDSSADAALTGTYYIRELLIAGQNSSGAISSAYSAIGTATFDGKGNYSFNGQGVTSGSAVSVPVVTQGTYSVGANGLLRIASAVAGNETAFGGVSALGPSAFVASATEGGSVDIMIGIPAGSSAGNAALSGSYAAGYIEFLNANLGFVREATFSGTANGSGSFGTFAISGKAANLGGTPLTQSAQNVAYSLTGSGSGTINFGAANPSQLISGTKNLYISADQNIILGGSPAGFDLLIGIRSLASPASNSTVTGEYYIAGIENYQGANHLGENLIDGFYGSANANGAGAAVFHDRFQSFSHTVFDYTFDSQYSVASSGIITPTDIPYQITLGASGRAYLATGTGSLYSLVAALGTQQYSGPGVYLNPLGVVNAANFAPITNPVAPGELVSLYGTGLASSTMQAQNLPLPTSLGNVEVMVNGKAAPLFYVSPTQITILIPSSVSPANNVNYASIQVVNGSSTSNAVTVYTNNTAPGVFSSGGDAIGPAAAQRAANYSLITSTNPATPGSPIVVYYAGGGSVSPAVADGAAAPSNPPAMAAAEPMVYFSGEQGNTLFAGLTPGLAGLYQLNAQVPAGMPAGNFYIDVSTPDAYTSETTISIAGTSGASVVSGDVTRRDVRAATGAVKGPGLSAR